MRSQVKLKIAGVPFLVESDFEPVISDNFTRFITRNEPKYKIGIFHGDAFSCDFEKTIKLSENTDVVLSENGIRKFYKLTSSGEVYATSFFEPGTNSAEVRYFNDSVGFMKHLENSFFCASAEDILLEESSFFFHACCVDTRHGALLFSGDSGIGKSTQGRLWEKYQNSSIVSDDRPIVGRKDGVWFAHSSPVSGRFVPSGNVSDKINSLVFLVQGKANVIERIDKNTAIKEMIRQSAFAFCEKKQIMKMLDLLDDFCEKVNIYRYKCLPDVSAVEFLDKVLEEQSNE